MDHLTSEQVAKINKVSLAEKHECSAEYVSQVLKGGRRANTDKAKAILKDGFEIIKVLEGTTTLEPTKSQSV